MRKLLQIRPSVKANYSAFNGPTLLYIIFIPLIIAVAALVRLKGMDSSIWLDEAWRIELTRHPINPETAGNPVPLLQKVQQVFGYTVILRSMIAFFGENEELLRIVSVLFGMGSVVLTLWIAGRYFNRRTVVFAGSMMALSAIPVFQSSEIGVYSIVLFLTVAYSAFVVTLNFQSPRKIIAALLAILIISSLHIFFGLFAATLTLASYLIRTEQAVRLTKTTTYGLIITSLVALLYWSQNSGVVQANAISLRSGMAMLEQSLASVLSMAIIADTRWIPSPSWVHRIAVITAILIIFVTSLSRNIREIRKDVTIKIFTIGILGFASVLAIQSVFTSVSFPRYFLGAIPIAYLVIGYVVSFLPSRKWTLFCVIFIANAAFLNERDNVVRKIRPDVRDIVADVKNLCQNRNYTILIPEAFEIPIYKHYLSASGRCRIVYTPWFKEYFELGSVQVLFPSEKDMQLQVNWLQVRMQDADNIIMIGERSKSTMDRLIESTASIFHLEKNLQIGNVRYSVLTKQRM